MTGKPSGAISGFLVVLAALLQPSLAGAQMRGDHSGPVMNYHRIDDRLVTGGHLVGDGVGNLKEQGVAVVIDLRDDSPRDEQTSFANAGIKWINVPVEWRDPQDADFDRFAEVMNEYKGEHVLVQCGANYRASAMTYLYRVLVDGVPEEDAADDLHAVWDPDDDRTWRKYIEKVKSSRQQ